jgi:hypothetical protein
MGHATSKTTSERPPYKPLPNLPALTIGDSWIGNFTLLSRWIRLLRILPGCGSSEIQCELKVANLALLPKFEALSYVWGCPDPAQEIDLDGHHVSVTRNLFAALTRLRLPDKERLIWIDALCIDQGNQQERESQVLLMRDIYSMPERVIVWLGEDEGQAAEAITVIKRAAEYFYSEIGKTSNDNIWYSDLEAIKTEDNIFATENRPGLPPIKPGEIDLGWAPVKWFYDRPWFRRIWVVQEVAFSQVIMYVGDLEVDWQTVVSAATWMFRKEYAMVVSCEYAMWMHGARRIGDDLVLALRLFQDNEATNPRDKVFALLGLLKRSSRHNPLLRPNYSKPVADVYSDAFRYMIQFCNDGKLLRLINSQNKPLAEADEAFPSWVPRFDLASPLKHSNPLHPETSEQSQSQPLLVKSIDSKVLILKGAIISTISLADSSADGDLEGGDSYLRSLWKTTKDELGPHYTPEGLENAFVQTVTAAGRWRRSAEKARRYLKEIIRGEPHQEEQYDTQLLDFIDNGFFKHYSLTSFREDRAATESIARYTTDQLKLKGGEDPVIETKKALILENYSIRNFSFLITDNGRMGLAAKVAEPRDKVCVFHGYAFPFLIRKAGEHYKLLGPCYIHGLIEGEAFQELKAGRLEEEWISLR